jgi:hypothetical protein
LWNFNNLMGGMVSASSKVRVGGGGNSDRNLPDLSSREALLQRLDGLVRQRSTSRALFHRLVVIFVIKVNNALALETWCMAAQQLDLFSGGTTSGDPHPPQQRALAPASLEDAALIEAIPDAGIANAPELAAEAGRRRLAAAVQALERLCRRFVGFGSDRAIPEQVAAVEVSTYGPPRLQEVFAIRPF